MPGSLSRLFCLGGGPAPDDDWAPGRYGQQAASGPRSRVLGLVEEELEERFRSLPPQGQQAQEAQPLVPARRVHQAALPAAELRLCRDLLQKVASLDAARLSVEQECQELVQQLQEAEVAHRQAEFSRARAEALATARGEALMHSQQVAREAELQQLQLSTALKQALAQLGVEVTPCKSPGSQEASPYEAPARQSLAQHNRQQAAAQQQQQAAAHKEQASGTPTGLGKRPRSSQEPVAASVEEPELSGFTVYTNELGSPEFAEVAQPEPLERSGELRGGRIPWRDISCAAGSSLDASVSGAELEQEQALYFHHQQQQQQQRRSSSSSRGEGSSSRGSARRSMQQLQQQAGQPDKRQLHAAKLARLVLPHLDASALDSLVRVGSSLASLDHPGAAALSPKEMLEQLLPASLWDSGINPVRSDLDAELLLHHLAQEHLRGVAASRGASAAAGASFGGGAGGLGPHELLYSRKFAGAGTWLSPSMSSLQAHRAKAGTNPFLDESAEPSPPSHIKAVFGTQQDRAFYGPFGAHLSKPGPAAPAASSRPLPEVGVSAESIQPRVRASRGSQSLAHQHLAPAEGKQPHPQQPPAQQRQPAQRQQQQGRPAGESIRESRLLDPSKSLALLGPRSREAAFLQRFQPMGMAQQHQEEEEEDEGGAGARPPPRQQRSSHLGMQRDALARRSSASAPDENAGGRPPLHQPANLTKRSMDSITASLDAAMAALAVGAGAGAPAAAAPAHARTTSMPAALGDATNWQAGGQQQQKGQRRLQQVAPY